MAVTGRGRGNVQGTTMNVRRFSICRLVGVVVAAWLAVACGPTAPAPANAPSASVAAGAPTVSPAPTLSGQEIDEAARFRKRYGLRADDAWIVAVAQVGAARAGVEEFGVPLMPFEIGVLHARRTDRDALRQVQDYGDLHPEQYAGAYIDERHSMGFIVMFTGSLDRHRTTLANLLPESVRLEVVPVRWSSAELEDYLATKAYVCQPLRSFRDQIRYLGFYKDKAIQPAVAAIRHRRKSVVFSRDEGTRLRASGDPVDAEVAALIERRLADGPDGREHQVFLLSGRDEPDTVMLSSTITHPGRGAWTQAQRYTSSAALRSSSTTDELSANGG